ncbi:MAG TPA: hypothetical protein VEV43_09310 [Actinomycetota bacterium]|nr:hypothetical protein [Actinomycetota bacterium]
MIREQALEKGDPSASSSSGAGSASSAWMQQVKTQIKALKSFLQEDNTYDAHIRDKKGWEDTAGIRWDRGSASEIVATLEKLDRELRKVPDEGRDRLETQITKTLSVFLSARPYIMEYYAEDRREKWHAAAASPPVVAQPNARQAPVATANERARRRAGEGHPGTAYCAAGYGDSFHSGSTGHGLRLNDLHATLSHILQSSEQLEKWGNKACAEIPAINRALNAGLDAKKLRISTARQDDRGSVSNVPPCENCRAWLELIGGTHDYRIRPSKLP